jgi:hypothetical protein
VVRLEVGNREGLDAGYLFREASHEGLTQLR